MLIKSMTRVSSLSGCVFSWRRIRPGDPVELIHYQDKEGHERHAWLRADGRKVQVWVKPHWLGKDRNDLDAQRGYSRMRKVFSADVDPMSPLA